VIAAPWSSADFLHGPIAIVEPGFPILAIAPSGPTLPGMRELLTAARSRGADVTVIADDASVVGRRIALEPVPEWLAPLVAVIPAQLLAVGAAEHLGRDVDRPTGLKKVTLTS
jgi:glutamine---fructose-6-phosphate transaminase (isomerizing)